MINGKFIDNGTGLDFTEPAKSLKPLWVAKKMAWV